MNHVKATLTNIAFFVSAAGEKVIKHWSRGEMLNPVVSKTFQIMSLSIVFTITLTRKRG